jgi:TRAP-type C4-dicarboxylate transport system substrate-binding protein
MTTTPRTPLAALAALALIACGGTACSGSSQESEPEPGNAGAPAGPAAATDAPSPAGKGGPAVTLRLGTDDGPDTPGAQQITHFAQQVADLSDGAITVAPVWHADDGQPHWDQYVAGMVMDGRLDLGMVPSRAWDDVGVDSLRALTAPFLVTTDTLTAAVVSDDHLVDQLTSGLPAVGVSALGLFPEGLRHPFGFHGPLRGAADYQGGVVRAGWSRTANSMFQALGATTTDDIVDTSTMIGAESSYRLSPAGEATGNVVFYPKVNVLVIDDEARSGLTDEQVAVLHEAADATQAWVLDTLPTDAKSAATFCQETGKIGSASQADLDSLVAATAGTIQALRSDDTTATLIDEIRAMAASDPEPEPVTGCPSDSTSDVSLINGSFRFSMTAAQMTAGGITGQDDIDENAGDYVMTLRDGTWEMEQHYTAGPKTGTTFHGTGGYKLTGHRVKWFWGHEPGEWTESDAAIQDDGSITFSNIHDGGDAQAQAMSELFFSHWGPKKS